MSMKKDYDVKLSRRMAAMLGGVPRTEFKDMPTDVNAYNTSFLGLIRRGLIEVRYVDARTREIITGRLSLPRNSNFRVQWRRTLQSLNWKIKAGAYG